MERNDAACAMDWSIELEKGLRSKRPDFSIFRSSFEAILQIGWRPEQWSREPEPTMSVYNLFNVFPGEDRLFANTILLRLADAFSKGDKHVRIAVVRIFLSEWRHRNKKMRQRGILTKNGVNNHLELLRRVKLVYDSGDVESRALSLILLGCWAHFSKDSAEIRYMILSTLVSSDVLEVKASLFAAGCLCELCTYFANVILEMLVNMLTLSETPVVVRLAGVKLLEKWEVHFCLQTMLTVLSISSHFQLLSDKSCLLFSYLTSETTLHVQTVALRSLHFILEKGPPFFPSTADSIQTLISILDEPKLSPSLQLQVLFCTLPNLDSLDISEFSKFLKVVEHAAHSKVLSVRLLAIRFLVDILVKKPEMEFNGASSNLLPTWVISIIQDKIIILLEKSVQDSGLVDSELNHEVQSLLKLLLVVEKYPNLVDLVLDRFASVINYIFSMHDVQLGQGVVHLSTDMILDFEGGKYSFIRSKFVNYTHKFLMALLSEIDGMVITEEVVDRVKL
ncbi:hypothetical protein RJ641_011725 [Dillenia turbinata]|uniref:Integrator complex subunit 7 N-terminal domain-containing protein n=1 Tax=Dillenia turbinata TaxID=194707 RepID=A0AAN8V4E1_9MAGN